MNLYADLPPDLSARDLIHILGSGEVWDEDDLARREAEDDRVMEDRREAR